LERNVLLAAICDAIIVIEALEWSGTKTTAAAAASMNIPVWVVPGSIFSPTSHGTHQLLLEWATPIYSQEWLCEFLWVLQYFENRGIKESPLLERLRIHGPASFMELHKLFGKSSLLQELFSLEMQWIISQWPDFRYYRNIF
jgi:DNA processing protein